MNKKTVSCIIISTVFLLITYNNSIAEAGKFYQLVGVFTNADFQYAMFTNFNQYLDEGINPLDIFQVRPGNYTVFRFVSAYWQKCEQTDQNILLHDVLLIKTDAVPYILDAYQYTLEYKDKPFSKDLYKLGNRKVLLKKQINIKELYMQNEYGKLGDEALLYNYYLGKEYF